MTQHFNSTQVISLRVVKIIGASILDLELSFDSCSLNIVVNVKVYFVKTIGNPTKICIECQLNPLITLHIMLFKTIKFQHFPIHETISDSISVEKNGIN